MVSVVRRAGRRRHGRVSRKVDNALPFKDVAVFRATVTSPEQIPGLLATAVRTAISRGAPAALTVPGDVDDNPFEVGQTDLIGNPAAAQAIDHADLLLLLGTDFPYRAWYPDRQEGHPGGHRGRAQFPAQISR
jgi:thiamine pyrophosphate-dependent acetolactate synthase large subunit-like protein